MVVIAISVLKDRVGANETGVHRMLLGMTPAIDLFSLGVER